MEGISFGHLALKFGYITVEQLEQALKVQKEQAAETGYVPKLGQVLVDLGFMTRSQVIDVVRHQASHGGKLIIENYEILGKLGSGAMGTVYKARQLSLNRIVALKILPPNLAEDKKYIARFLREAKLAAKLNHPNIIYVIDVGESQDVYYYAMEFVEGRTLKQIVDEEGPLPEKDILRMAIQVTDALDHAYSYGIVHRDVKPANIMLTNDGVVKLCDFGLARPIHIQSKATKTVIAGTPHYIAPEQIRDDNVDIRADIYSLGATIYYLATGRPPFTGETPALVMTKHLYEHPRPPRDLNPAISRYLEAIILKCLRKKPDDRFQTPGELHRVLEKLATRKQSSRIIKTVPRRLRRRK